MVCRYDLLKCLLLRKSLEDIIWSAAVRFLIQSLSLSQLFHLNMAVKLGGLAYK